MKKKSRKKSRADGAEKKFNAREAAQKLQPQLFKSLRNIATRKSGGIAALHALKKLMDLAGTEDVTDDYIIDLKLIEIAQDDNGNIVEVRRELPNLDNSLPLQGNDKLKKQINPDAPK